MADGGSASVISKVDQDTSPLMRKRTSKVESFSLSLAEFNEILAGKYPAGIEFFGPNDTEFKRPFARMTAKQVQSSLNRASLMDGAWRSCEDSDRKFWVTVPDGYWVCAIPAAARKR